MSSRADRRRDRSRDRDVRDREDRTWDKERYGASRRRGSRSRSPRRGGGGGSRGGSYRDRGGDRDRDRIRDRERDSSGRDYRGEYRRDRSPDKRDDRRRRDDRDGDRDRARERERDSAPPVTATISNAKRTDTPASGSASTPVHENAVQEINSAPEEGEDMDAENEDDAAMMAMMGMSGFGSTKGTQVTGNQEGGANIKKVRTWRQYMNRRGGFNRPLDKIK